jgi:hypothetical protein
LSAPASAQIGAGSVSPVAVAPARTLPELVARYIAWRGGPAYEMLQTIHETEYLEGPGGRQLRELWLDRDGRTRIETDFGSFRQILVVAPDGSWGANPSGQLVGSRNVFESSRRFAAIDFGDALLGRGGATVALVGPASVGGKDWTVARVSFGDADTYDVAIDPVSGALCCYRAVIGGVAQLQLFDDWRVVDGVRMPFAEITQGDEGVLRPKMSVVEINKSIDASTFRPPPSARLTAFAPGASWSGWIDFQLFADRQIYLPVKVNGHAVSALLDSGATSSVLDRRFAAEIGLSPAGNVAIAGADSMSAAGFVRGVSIELGQLRLTGVTAASLDLAPAGTTIGHAMPFVLGQEAMHELVLDIDFAHRRLAFRDPASFSAPSGASAIPLGPDGIPASIEGRPPATFLFDLGAAAPIEIFPAYAQSRGLLAGRKLAQSLSVAINGEAADKEGVLNEVDLAAVPFAAVPAVFSDRRQPQTDNAVAGRIGMGLLSRFRLMVDYPQHRLFLIPQTDAVTRPFQKDRLGLALASDGTELVVKLVSPGSPAQVAGFVVGDKLTSVDGHGADVWSLARQREVFGEAPGTIVRFTLVGGKVRTAKLADYY